MPSSLKLTSIRKDEKLQPRATIDMDVVSDYAEFVRGGGDLPAVGVVFDEKAKCYWLWDGYHRAAAYEMAGALDVPATITKGTAHDAFIMSLSANATHGQRRTNADKRRAVSLALADPEIAKMSNRQVADLCAVSHMFVSEIRGQVETVSTCGEEKRIGKDKKEYRVKPVDHRGKEIIEPQEGTAATGKDVVATKEGVGKPEPGDKEADPAQDSPEVYDGPKHLTSVFAIGPLFDSAMASLAETKKAIDQIATKPGGEALAAESTLKQIRIDVRHVRESLEACKPHSVCDRCGGAGCNICMQRGWLSRPLKREKATA